MQRSLGKAVWWATCAALTSALAPSVAQETKARLSVSATVVRPCRISLPNVPTGTKVDARLPKIDCGPKPATSDVQGVRVLSCDRARREPWCLHLQELHAGREIRVVRFD